MIIKRILITSFFQIYSYYLKIIDILLNLKVKLKVISLDISIFEIVNSNFMDSIIEFFSFSDPTIRYVTLGVLLLTGSSAIVGAFFMFQKKSLVGDAVAHSMLPGLCLGFILSGNKNPVFLICGAFISGWVSLFLIEYIPQKSKVKEETATSMVLSVFFGFGILLLKFIQNIGSSGQSGLQNFLFGKAASLLKSDVRNIAILSLIIIVTVLLLFKEFRLISFDKNFGNSIGFPIKFLNFILSVLIILSITVGIQTVGVVLMAAMLITPPAAARFWTNRLEKVVFLASLFGMVSGILGTMLSYLAPSMPTGPWIVVVMSTIAFFSFLFSPEKGIVSMFWNKYIYRIKIERENILKLFYELGIKDHNFNRHRTIPELRKFRYLPNVKFMLRMRSLVNSGYLNYDGAGAWYLTPSGRYMGAYVLKLHCLWEAYLTKYLRLNPNHVHEAAESIEHILTPELERELAMLMTDVPTTGFYDKNPRRKIYR